MKTKAWYRGYSCHPARTCTEPIPQLMGLHWAVTATRRGACYVSNNASKQHQPAMWSN